MFILSPASCRGQRARLLFNEGAAFDAARRLRSPEGMPLGDAFAFLSGLYFRGKLAYARAFARPGAGTPGVVVITPCEGFRRPEEPVDLARLQRYALVPIDGHEPRYRAPLERDARGLARDLDRDAEVVLLGSVASGKYVDLLGDIFGSRLRFPAEFVGRGDMSRGGLLLRCVAERRELAYVPVAGAIRHGPRPPRLVPRPGLLKSTATDGWPGAEPTSAPGRADPPATRPDAGAAGLDEGRAQAGPRSTRGRAQGHPGSMSAADRATRAP